MTAAGVAILQICENRMPRSNAVLIGKRRGVGWLAKNFSGNNNISSRGRPENNNLLYYLLMPGLWVSAVLVHWGFAEVYAVLRDFADRLDFDTDREDYLVHITTGTHVAQICLFLLTETRHLPARLVQTAPPRRKRKPDPGKYAIIDLELGAIEEILPGALEDNLNDLINLGLEELFRR